MKPGLTSVLSGHVGNKVSALVDGQLSEDEAEQIWSHVLVCPPCRRAAEQVGWTKTRVWSACHAPAATREVPMTLLGSLYAVEARAELRAEIMAEVRAEFQEELRTEVGRVERAARRRTTVAIVGVSSASLAMMGLMAVAASPTERVEHIPVNTSNIGQPQLR